MTIKYFCLASLVLLASCLTDDDPKKVERWYLDSWEGTFNCMLGGPFEEGEKNKIIETLLDLEHSAMADTELHLGSDGEMQIVKNNVVELSGGWSTPERHILTLTANDQLWNFEVVTRNEDSILLRGENYQYIYQVDIVLKRR